MIHEHEENVPGKSRGVHCRCGGERAEYLAPGVHWALLSASAPGAARVGTAPGGSLQQDEAVSGGSADLKRWHYWLPLAGAGGALLLASALNCLGRNSDGSKTVIVVKK